MDPNVTLENTLSLAKAVLDDEQEEPVEFAATFLAAQVIELHEWLMQGGFLPSVWGSVKVGNEGTRAQGIALAARIKSQSTTQIFTHQMDLPDGYWFVKFSDGFVCGISREGDVSS